MTIRLPEKPEEQDYEDFVSSCLLSMGYYIEYRVELKKESTQVLELDIVATPSDDNFNQRVLFEVKSKSFKLFNSVFKLLGQMHYLEINNGRIVHKIHIDEQTNKVAREIGDEVAIRCCQFNNEIDSLDSLAPLCIDMSETNRKAIVVSCWYGKIAQRIGFAQLVKRSKSENTNELLFQARKYYYSVQQSFFRKRPIKRVDSLYKAYQESPNLTGQFVEMLSERESRQVHEIWNDLWNTEKHLWLQSFMLLEHRARISIIKNALDHIVSKNTAETVLNNGKKVNTDKLYEQIMPDNFRNGLSILREHNNSFRIPYLFQIFIEVCGGFYINNEVDIQHISNLSGIPENDIIPCLKLIDDIFPIKNGWFSIHGDELVIMKLIPAAIRGIGCFLRKRLYDTDNYEKISSQRGFWLSRWHNL